MQLMHVAEISSTKSNVTVVTTCHKMTGMSGTNQQSTKLEVRPVNLTCALRGEHDYPMWKKSARAALEFMDLWTVVEREPMGSAVPKWASNCGIMFLFRHHLPPMNFQRAANRERFLIKHYLVAFVM